MNRHAAFILVLRRCRRESFPTGDRPVERYPGFLSARSESRSVRIAAEMELRVMIIARTRVRYQVGLISRFMTR